MILNSGLDAACVRDANGSGAPATAAYLPFGNFVQYACFGTGSAAPTAADTALDAQVGSRSNSRGGFNNAEAAGQNSGTNTIWYEGTFTRVFDIAGNVNVTEWGLAPATTGNLSVRELFRADPLDNNSSPITLTLEAGDQLQLVVTFRVQAAWEYETKSFVITGTAGNDTNGTHDGNATLTAGYNTTPVDIGRALSAAWPGGPQTSYGTLAAYSTSQSAVAKGDLMAGANTGTTLAAAAYTPGDYYRDWVGEWGTGTANHAHYAWNAGGFNIGYRFILTNPATLTKTSAYKLTLTVRKAIARL